MAKINRSGFSRRSILRAGLVGAASAGLPTTSSIFSPLVAAESVTKISTIFALSGPFAGAAKPQLDGANLAIETLGKDYGLNLQSTSIDSEGNPGRCAPKVIGELRSGTRFFSGGTLSSVILAISSEINRAGGMLTTAVGADEITGADCNLATFRWSVPTFGAVEQSVRPLTELLPHAKRWYTITPKYVFGEALLRTTKNILKEKALEHVGNSYHSLTDNEFSGHITNAAAAKPDVLVLLNFGGQSTKCLREVVQFGLKSKMNILLVWAAGLEQYQELGTDVIDGIYFGSQYEHQIENAPNKKFVSIYKQNLGKLPSYLGANGYACIQIIAESMKKSGSKEPAEVMKAAEILKYEGPTGNEEVRKFDHQVVKDYYLVVGKSPSKKKYDDDYVEILHAGKSFQTEAQSECKLPPRN